MHFSVNSWPTFIAAGNSIRVILCYPWPCIFFVHFSVNSWPTFIAAGNSIRAILCYPWPCIFFPHEAGQAYTLVSFRGQPLLPQAIQSVLFCVIRGPVFFSCHFVAIRGQTNDREAGTPKLPWQKKSIPSEDGLKF